MVRILDGEIVQDNDPRLSAQHRAQPGTSTRAPATASPSGASPGPFDLSAPAFRLAPDPPELRLFNLSGVDVFGCHCLARHWAMMLGSSFFLGLKGPLLGAAIWAAYKYYSHGSSGGNSSSGPSNASGPGTQQSGAGVQQFLSNYLTQNPRQPNPGQGQQPASGPPGWAGRGAGQKLGSGS